MGNLWMAFVYPGSFLSLLGIVLLIIGYQRRRTGKRTRLEGAVAQPGPPAPGEPRHRIVSAGSTVFADGRHSVGAGLAPICCTGRYLAIRIGQAY